MLSSTRFEECSLAFTTGTGGRMGITAWKSYLGGLDSSLLSCLVNAVFYSQSTLLMSMHVGIYTPIWRIKSPTKEARPSAMSVLALTIADELSKGLVTTLQSLFKQCCELEFLFEFVRSLFKNQEMQLYFINFTTLTAEIFHKSR